MFTLGGPMIVPVHLVRLMSESSSSPQLMFPSPLPFWPSSSSSSSRNIGTASRYAVPFRNGYKERIAALSKSPAGSRLDFWICDEMTMRAAVVRAFGAADCIEIALNHPKPALTTANSVLVRVIAAGVNPVDTYIRAGQYAALPTLPYTPGKDGSGIVEQVGSDVKHVKVGDRVWMIFLQTGTSAEFCIADKCFPLPSRGVGLAACQLADWKGLHVTATAGTEQGMQLVKENGANAVYNHREQGYLDKLKKDFKEGFDLIVEMAAHINLNSDTEMLARGGKIAVVGNRAETNINARNLMRVEGSIFGVAAAYTTDSEFELISSELSALFNSTSFRPIVHKTYPLEELAAAHTDIMTSSGAMGNHVIIISDE
ncbi:hypothetical protein WR25_07194 [Diploscapter pachys]|uniref:Enoyl reductase (ER) domain-containing protein n=1 Tax=Diploscapter pachys TaxID=2018661 RepID=A0A2A2KFV2_9BILA|nr:hypothetical protein WR25_07194 [Diploscapter pachys]